MRRSSDPPDEMSRKFRPGTLGSQSGMYSVRGSELARAGNTNPSKLRCVVELLDDSEFVIDIEVNRSDFLFRLVVPE